MIKQLFLIGVLALLTTGCTNMLNVGASDYGCKGMPNGVTCMSAKDVYSATENDDFKSQLAQEQDDAKEEKGAQPGNGTRVLYAEGSDNAPMPIRARNPLPIRTQAVVMRIAVDPWEDENGDLWVPGYVYTEVEARRWEIGSRQNNVKATLRPLAN